MIDPGELLRVIAFGGASAALFLGLAGVRRLPWRHAALMGVGFVTIFAALWLASSAADLPALVLVGAIGGALAQFGFDRGERERNRISREIISRRSTPPA